MKPETCYLELPFLQHIQESVLSYFEPDINPKVLPRKHYKWNIEKRDVEKYPFVKEFEDATGLRITKIGFFSLGANEKSSVHNERGLGVRTALNMTVYGGPDSNLMKWFDIPDQPGPGHLTDPEILKNVSPAFEKYINIPTLVNIDEWHQALNMNTHSHRLAVTMRFFGDPDFEECKEKILTGYASFFPTAITSDAVKS